MVGRKPTPTRLKIIRGNPGKRSLGKEPPFETEIPAKPPELTGEASVEWDRLTAQLSTAGVLRTVDRNAIMAYCRAWARWVDAEQKIDVLGLVTRSPIKGIPMQNPYLAIANKAMAQMMKWAAEFGLTPASRARLGEQGHGNKDPLDLFSQRRQAAKTKGA